MTRLREPFPFPIRAYFPTLGIARKEGWEEGQVWSLVEATDESDGLRYRIYGPARHSYPDGASYAATDVHHDFNTFYEEEI